MLWFILVCFFICSVMLTFFQSSTFDFFLALISRTKYSLDIPHARSPLDWRAFSIYTIGAFSCQSQPSVGCYPQAPPSCSLSPPTYLIPGAVARWRHMLQQWWAVERALVSSSLHQYNHRSPPCHFNREGGNCLEEWNCSQYCYIFFCAQSVTAF